MNQEYSFNATIVDAGGCGAFVRVPLDKEHVRAILDARREETRRNRIAKAIQMLLKTSKDS